MRRCGFFLEVFGLTMPDYLQCDIFPESTDTDVCLGNKEVIDVRYRDDMPGELRKIKGECRQQYFLYWYNYVVVSFIPV